MIVTIYVLSLTVMLIVACTNTSAPQAPVDEGTVDAAASSTTETDEDEFAEPGVLEVEMQEEEDGDGVPMRGASADEDEVTLHGCDAKKAFQDKFTSVHNQARQEATAEDGIKRDDLVWSNDYACQAQEWARIKATNTEKGNPHTKKKDVSSAHSNLRSWDTKANAENAAAGQLDLAAAFEGWKREKDNVNLALTGKARCDKKKGQCGHYLNMIKPERASVGCGSARTNNAVWYVCQFGNK